MSAIDESPIDPGESWADDPHPAWICEPGSHRLLAVNDAAVERYGYERDEFLAMSLSDLEVIPQKAVTCRPSLAACASRPDRFTTRRHRLKSGAVIDVELFAYPAWQAGRAVQLVFANDVTECRQASRTSRTLSRQLQVALTAFEHSADAITITDRDNRIVMVNAAFTRITGYTESEVLGKSPRVLASGRQDRAFYQQMWGAILGKGHWEGEIWNRRKNGAFYPEWLKISAVRDEHGEVSHHVAMFSDISATKATEAQLHRLAFYDALTGLPNRVLARERLGAAMAEADRLGRQVGVLFIDLDRFKIINDSLGHGVGDRLLQVVAARLSAAVRGTDTVARLGGDEFLLVLPGIDHADDVAPVAAKLVQRVSEPVGMEERTLRVTPSIGIALYPADGADCDTLLRNADTAMYEAKRGRRSGYHYFSADLHESATRRWQLESDLRRALAQREFVLHYQPQVDLASGSLVGYEALVRWRHPQRGMIAPDQFIPSAEETGLIVELGQWVLREACRQNRAWQDAGRAALPVAVNVSAQEFQRPDYYETVSEALAQHGLGPRYLELELTEGIVMSDAHSAIELMHRLRALGVRLAIDDFGTGYSSLGYLRRLPVDKLKIDRSFIQCIEHTREDLAITQSVIALARSLQLEVVAEGVETAGQAQVLRDNGCGQAQGYFFGRPALPGLLQSDRKKRRGPALTHQDVHA